MVELNSLQKAPGRRGSCVSPPCHPLLAFSGLKLVIFIDKLPYFGVTFFRAGNMNEINIAKACCWPAGTTAHVTLSGLTSRESGEAPPPRIRGRRLPSRTARPCAF